MSIDREKTAASSIARQLGLRTVFVAGPFFNIVDPMTGVMGQQDRERIEQLIDYFEDSGCVVHNAHRREHWGGAMLEPDDFTKLDYDEINSSDVLVAVPGPPASLGTHIELGWASRMGKPIVLLLEQGEDYTQMLYGLHQITRTSIVHTVGGRFALEAFERALSEVFK